MSKSVYVGFRDQGFWAFDVIVSIFLKHLVEVAEPTIADNPWLAEVVHHWRVGTVIPDCSGVHLDDTWSDKQLAAIIHLFEDTCKVLEQRNIITAEEVAQWQLLDGMQIFCRGISVFSSKSIVELGHAIILMLNGKLPPAPEGTWWWYGIDDHPKTIARLTEREI